MYIICGPGLTCEMHRAPLYDATMQQCQASTPMLAAQMSRPGWKIVEFWCAEEENV